MNEDIEPGWFLRWKNNDYTHLKDDVTKIKEKINLSWKLQLVELGAILTGAIGVIVALILKGVL